MLIIAELKRRIFSSLGGYLHALAALLLAASAIARIRMLGRAFLFIYIGRNRSFSSSVNASCALEPAVTALIGFDQTKLSEPLIRAVHRSLADHQRSGKIADRAVKESALTEGKAIERRIDLKRAALDAKPVHKSMNVIFCFDYFLSAHILPPRLFYLYFNRTFCSCKYSTVPKISRENPLSLCNINKRAFYTLHFHASPEKPSLFSVSTP